MTSATAYFTRLAASIVPGDLSPLAMCRAKTSIIDAVGCILAGARSKAVDVVVREAELARASAPVLGRRDRLPPSWAALANGTAGHAHDYDDSSPPMIGHPSVPIVSAMLAVADGARTNGADLLAGYAAGLEIAAGLGRRLNPAHYAAGWHATATLATLGATVAACRVLRLPADRIAAGIGIGAATAGGIRKNFGSMVKPLHAGLAARNGVIAAKLGRAGIVADPEALDGAAGFMDVFKGAAAPTDFVPADRLEIERTGISIKRYPCCGCSHTAIDVILRLRATHRVQADAVVAIHCTTNHLVPGILVHHRPKTPAQAQFSMDYCLAVALLDGECGLRQFDPARVLSADVQALLERVTTEVDPSIDYRNGVYPSELVITLRDGTTLRDRGVEALGHPDFPLEPTELRGKFLACASRALSDAASEAAYDALDRIECLERITDLTRLLTPDGCKPRRWKTKRVSLRAKAGPEEPWTKLRT